MNIRHRLRGLRGKLLFAFWAMALAPLLVMGVSGYIIARNALQSQAMNQLISVRDMKNDQLHKFFGERQSDMGVLMETVGTLRSEALNKLTAVREVKRSAIERYFQSINDQILTFSEDRMIVEAMRQFQESFQTFRTEAMIEPDALANMQRDLQTYYAGEFADEYQARTGSEPPIEQAFRMLDDDSIALQYQYIRMNRHPLGSKHLLDRADDASRYTLQHGIYHPIIRSYLEKFGYYDIFLVDSDTGDIVYSVFKELDYSTSLIDGPYAKTNFGEAFRQANNAVDPNAVVLVDYESYTPSYEDPASFIASPIFDGDEKVGVAIFQMPIARLNEVMTERAGLGETGETYLVGPDHLMRSDSYLDPEHHSVIASFRNPETGDVRTKAANAALEGDTGADVIIDYNGNPVLSAYTPVKVGGFTWALLAEIDVAEAFSPVDQEGNAFYEQYIDLYGYYDLFLMNPDGYVFYTVAKEADYQTNLLDGPYADSNLGQLVDQVLQSKTYGIADFASYAPSNGEPAAFIAQPVVNNGTVEVVVALQLSLEAINAIMFEQRSGMGNTGETYLVGPDSLMRSKSYLDQEHRTVKASFANREQGSIDTDAVREALAGDTAEKIITNYLGNQVLSAYAPLNVPGLNWAVISEIDESEAFRSVYEMREMMLWVGGIATAIIIVLAMVIAGSIAKPVELMSNAVAQLADGDLDVRVSGEQRRDEIGLLATSMRRMIHSLREMVTVAEQIAAGDLTVHVNVRSDKDALGKALADMASDLQQQIKELVEGINVLASSASEISASVTQMASSAAETSTSVSETTTTLEEVRQTSELANQKSQQVSAGAQQAAQVSQAGRKATEDTVDGMHRIREQMESIADSIVKLSEQSQTIGGIISSVNDLSDQSNLLAVNASIEAAKAGEQGKGFTVVAQEIRSLAEQSKQATTQVQLILNNIQKATSAAVMATEQGTKAVEAGVKQSSEAGQSILSLAQNITDTAQAMTQIAASGQQQVIGMNQIAEAMESIKQASVQNVDSSHQLESAAGNLQELGQRLKRLVDRYTV